MGSAILVSTVILSPLPPKTPMSRGEQSPLQKLSPRPLPTAERGQLCPHDSPHSHQQRGGASHRSTLRALSESCQTPRCQVYQACMVQAQLGLWIGSVLTPSSLFFKARITPRKVTIILLLLQWPLCLITCKVGKLSKYVRGILSSKNKARTPHKQKNGKFCSIR